MRRAIVEAVPEGPPTALNDGLVGYSFSRPRSCAPPFYANAGANSTEGARQILANAHGCSSGSLADPTARAPTEAFCCYRVRSSPQAGFDEPASVHYNLFVMTREETSAPFIHSTALVRSSQIGSGTRIWAFCNILEGARIGKNGQICDRVFIESGAVIGDDVTVKCGVSIWDGITIEDGVFVGPGVMFTNDPAPRSKRHLVEYPRTFIGAYASLGAGSIILPGLRIGSYSMIAAGAVVTRDTPNHSLMIGNPARQRNWVCVCGRRLDEASPRTCHHCRRTFREVGGHLHLLEGSPLPWEES